MKVKSFTQIKIVFVQIMLHAKIGKAKDKQIDDLFEQIELSKTTLQVAREYWYLSQAYAYLNILDKSKDCLKKSRDTLEAIAENISNENYRNDYLNKPLIHQLIRGKIKDFTPKKVKKIIENVKEQKEQNKSKNIFSFCSNCGFDNSKQFKFCPKCGTSLES